MFSFLLKLFVALNQNFPCPELRTFWNHLTNQIFFKVLTKKSFLKGSICSTVAGFTSFCVHAGGTPTSIYLLPLRMQKEIYVGTRVVFFTLVNLIKFPFYINLSMITFESFKQSILLFPLSIVGILIGYQILKYVEESIFYNIIYIIILITSSKLLYSFFLV